MPANTRYGKTLSPVLTSVNFHSWEHVLWFKLFLPTNEIGQMLPFYSNLRVFVI